jgi:hypothetical protein
MIKLLKRFAKKIELLNEHVVGIYEGDICHRNFCLGTIRKVDGSCSCSTCGNPPCGYCTNAPVYCDTCGWEDY